jgi:hypothetical protein
MFLNLYNLCPAPIHTQPPLQILLPLEENRSPLLIIPTLKFIGQKGRGISLQNIETRLLNKIKEEGDLPRDFDHLSPHILHLNLAARLPYP